MSKRVFQNSWTSPSLLQPPKDAENGCFNAVFFTFFPGFYSFFYIFPTNLKITSRISLTERTETQRKVICDQWSVNSDKKFSVNSLPLIEIIPLPEPDSSENKKEKIIKYQCPACKSSIWGKQDIIDICWDCFELRIRQDISEEEYSPKYLEKVQIARIILKFLRKIKSRLFQKAEAKYKEKEGEKK